jgi:ribosomal protein S18 acetylase RimI-like enzyme
MPAPSLRSSVVAEDEARIRALVERTGFFSVEEVEIAAELVRETVARGEAAGYHFVLAEQAGQLLGYCCFGPIPCTRHSFDLYWIAVQPDGQGRGLGRLLTHEAERRIAGLGGQRVYVDTSGRTQYAPTRAFYERLGYEQASVLEDFYAPGDPKVVYCKVL